MLIDSEYVSERFGDKAGTLWLRTLLWKHGALARRSARLSSSDEFYTFCQRFGLETTEQHPQVQIYTCEGRDKGSLAYHSPAGSDFWHSDNSFKKCPAIATGLYSYDHNNMPEWGAAGETLLVDGAMAYDALPNTLKLQINKLRAEHVSNYNAGYISDLRALVEPLRASDSITFVHPVVRVHPHTQRPAIYVNPLYTTRMLHPDGTPLEENEGKELLDELYSHMLGPHNHAHNKQMDHIELSQARNGNFCASFQWMEPGDLLVWDNSRMLHRATVLESLGPGQVRKLFRVSVDGPEVLGTSNASLN